MWWKTAKAGDKIVCVDPIIADVPRQILEGGAVYTVFKTGDGEDCNDPCSIYFGVVETVWVSEVYNYYAVDGGFAAERFRPVDPASKKADRVLASLKPSLLNPIPIRKHETAGAE